MTEEQEIIQEFVNELDLNVGDQITKRVRKDGDLTIIQYVVVKVIEEEIGLPLIKLAEIHVTSFKE